MFRPLHQYVIIEVELESNVTSSGIYLSSDKKPSQKAKVIAVSSEVTEVKPGDTVIVGMYNPLDIKIGDESVTIIDFDDIYLVVE